LTVVVLLGIIALVASIVLWTKYIYGGPARQLENILDEIDE
jgi:uncharacterized membrane protein